MFSRSCLGAVLVTGLSTSLACCEDGKESRDWQALFNGKDLAGWKLREEKVSVIQFVDATGNVLTGARQQELGSTEVPHDANGKPLQDARIVVQAGRKVIVDMKGKEIPNSRIVVFKGRSTIVDEKGEIIRGAQLVKKEVANQSGWKVEAGRLACVQPHAGNDLVSREKLRDFELHIEFQALGNSGVYLQGRYEIQVDRSLGAAARVVQKDGQKSEVFQPLICGSIYGQIAPTRNMSRAPGEWQTFDVKFRSARGTRMKVEENPRVTLVWNGEKVIDDREIKGPTGGALDNHMIDAGPIMLQGDHDRVAFRNIRVRPLTAR